jgi:hypothetical protein
MGVETALLVGTLVSAGTAIYSGMEQKKEANAQADAAEAEGEFRQKQAEADAKAERDAALVRAEQIRKAGKAQQASARAAAAASGMEVDMGTALDLGSSIVEDSESDAQMSIFGGLDSFKRGNQEGESFKLRGENESSTLKRQGKAAMTAGFISAAKSVGSGYQDYSSGKV